MIDRARLHAVIDPVVSAHGAELCDFELKNENGWVLRIYVERLGAMANKLSTKAAAIDLDLCSNIARDLAPRSTWRIRFRIAITSKSARPASSDLFARRKTTFASPARRRS